MCSAKAIRRHACKIHCCWYLVGGLFAKVLPSPFFLPAKYTLLPSPPTQHRMGTIVLQTPGSTSQPVLASTTALSANVRKMRTRFHNLREAQKFQKPAPLPVRYSHCPSLKGLLVQCSLSHTRSPHLRQHWTTTSSKSWNTAPKRRWSTSDFFVFTRVEC